MAYTRHTRLEHLELTRTDVTDASVPKLLYLRNLQFLDIEGTAISQSGFDTLMKALPGGCEVVYRGETHTVE